MHFPFIESIRVGGPYSAKPGTWYIIECICRESFTATTEDGARELFNEHRAYHDMPDGIAADILSA